MRIDIMTLFPDAVDAMMNASIIGRAQERGFVTIRTHQIREFTTNRQMQVDAMITNYPDVGRRIAAEYLDGTLTPELVRVIKKQGKQG